jgi:predicted RND superfamily exporter protein
MTGIKSRKRSLAVVLTVALLTLLPMFYGNIIVKKGGLLDDSLLNQEDPYYLMDKKAESFLSEGLKTSDSVPFVITFNPAFSQEELQHVQDLTNDLKAAFPEYGVLSLSVVPKYRDTGWELLNEPYVNDEELRHIAADRSRLKEWQDEVSQDSSAYGLLIGRRFDYATVNLLLPRGYDEIATFRRITEFLEQREIPWYEWFFKTDIHPAPKFKDLTVGGWATARGLMDAALVSDIIKLSTIGLMIVGIVFYLSLRSRRQAFIAVLIIVICFIWTRGSIGILQTLGIQVYERVYVLLVYTAIIVSGISFAARKFESYNKVRTEFPHYSREECWDKTRPLVNGMIWITAVNALVNFGTLYQIGIRGILEVGVFSALGIVYLLILVLWFLPALHSLTGGEACISDSSKLKGVADYWDRFLTRVVTSCHNTLDSDWQKPFVFQRTARLALVTTIALSVVAVVIISLDYIPFAEKSFKFLEVRTKPLDYLPGTIVYRASEILNRDESYGFDRLAFLVSAKNGINIQDHGFLSRTDELARKLKSLKDIREVNSVVDILRVISRESFKSDLPITEGEIHDALHMIEWDLGPKIKEQLWFDKGVVLFASFAANDSNRTGDLIESALAFATDQFPDLDVLPFGKIATYPQNDKYIREGKPWNILSSQWMVVGVCALWIMWRNRSLLHDAETSLRLVAWRTGFAISVPFVFASAVIVLVMIALRVPLDQATACITALTINAAIDFCLYLVADYHTALLSGKNLRQALEYALPLKGKIIVVDIMLNALCFAPLMTSRFLPVARMGWIMIVMLLACGFGSLVLLPALLPWCVKQKTATFHLTGGNSSDRDTPRDCQTTTV